MSQISSVTAREMFLAEVSTYLDSRCQHLANECRRQAVALKKKSGKHPDSTQLQCSACGSLDIHENMVVNSRKAKEGKLQLFKCQSCSRTTKKNVSVQLAERAKLNTVPKLSVSQRSALKSSEAPVAGKTSSKKRAKERKNQGLQAMLEKSKGPVQKSTSFGLMDFMSKQG